jgi:glycosyltransferase involved in cell wall biosynthesis
MGTPKQSLIILSTWTNPVMGGGELYLEKLIRPQSDFFDIYLISNNKTVIDFLIKYTSPIVKNNLKNYFLFNLVALFQLRKKIGKRHTVVLNGQGALYYSFYCRLLFKNVVAIHHQQFDADRNALKRIIKILLLIFTNKIVTVSNSLAEELSIYKNKITVIYNWIDKTYKEKFSDFKYQSSGNSFNLLYVARVEENKGIKDLVNAIANIDNVHLTVLGVGTSTDWVITQNLNDKITMEGWQSDIIPFVKKAHLLVQPSHAEGFSFVPVEVGIAGLPALISDLNVHKEISGNGEFAFLFSKGSVESLTEQIEKLSLDRFLLTEMSNKIQKHYQDNFLESDKFVNAYREAFEISDK